MANSSIIKTSGGKASGVITSKNSTGMAMSNAAKHTPTHGGKLAKKHAHGANHTGLNKGMTLKHSA